MATFTDEMNPLFYLMEHVSRVCSIEWNEISRTIYLIRSVIDGGQVDGIHAEFGIRLRKLIAESPYAGYTQRALAKLFGCGVGMLNTWLNGKRMPTMERALKVASILKCSVDYLLTGNDVTRVSIDEASQDHDLASALGITGLPDDMQEQLLKDVSVFLSETLDALSDEIDRRKGDLASGRMLKLVAGRKKNMRG